MTTPRRSGRLAKPESDVESGLPVLVSTSVKKKAATLVKAGKSTAPAPNKSDVPKHQSVPKSTSLKKAQKRARSGTTTSHSGSRKPGKKAKTTATLDESWKHKGKMKKSAGEASDHVEVEDSGQDDMMDAASDSHVFATTSEATTPALFYAGSDEEHGAHRPERSTGSRWDKSEALDVSVKELLRLNTVPESVRSFGKPCGLKEPSESILAPSPGGKSAKQHARTTSLSTAMRAVDLVEEAIHHSNEGVFDAFVVKDPNLDRPSKKKVAKGYQHKVRIEVVDTTRPPELIQDDLTDEDPEQFRNLKSATSISAKKATPSRTANEAKHARPSATTEAAAPKLKRVVQDVIALKHKGSSSAKGQRKEPKPKAKRVLAGLPAYARDPFGKIASPIFKTWASEQANPWDIPDEDVDLVMPLLWSTSTGKKWKSLEDVERQTAKNILAQRLFEWRSSIGTAACHEVREWFKNDTDVERRQHVRWALDPKKLNYRFENGRDRPFTSEYIIKTLVTALTNCGRPSEKIHVTDADDRPRGALVVTMAAVERALQFWETGSECDEQGTFDARTWAFAGNRAKHDAAAIAKLSAAQWGYIMHEIDKETSARAKKVIDVQEPQPKSSRLRLSSAERARSSLLPMDSSSAASGSDVELSDADHEDGEDDEDAACSLGCRRHSKTADDSNDEEENSTNEEDGTSEEDGGI